MACKGIGTVSGETARSLGSGIWGQYQSGFQTLTEAIDSNILLAQQLSVSGGYVGRVSVKPPVFYSSNPGVRFHQAEPQLVLACITNDETKYQHLRAAIPEDVAINLPMGL